jgi:hypothetical protein
MFATVGRGHARSPVSQSCFLTAKEFEKTLICKDFAIQDHFNTNQNEGEKTLWKEASLCR